MENFLVQPLLTGNFFDYSLRLEPELTHPIIVHEKKTTINIWAWEPVRYRYKFFPANRVNCFPDLLQQIDIFQQIILEINILVSK